MLVLDEEVPFPPNSGKRIRTWHFLRRLADDFEITLLTHCQEAHLKSSLPSEKFTVVELKEKVPPLRGFGFFLRLLHNVISPYPFSVHRHYSAKMAEHLEQLVPQIDLLHCEWTIYAAYLRHVPGIPCVLAAHNVESEIWERYFRTERNPLRKAFFWLQWQKMQRFERSVLPQFDGVIAVSKRDRQKLLQLGARKVLVVENGVDSEYFSPRAGVDKSDQLVFCGSLDWRPNQDALRYFLQEVFPRVQAVRKTCRLQILGRNPPKDLARWAQQQAGVEWIGEVEDVRPWLGQASVVVVPLRIGGGSRIKILEAWAMERAVVSTSIGAEGLPARARENLLLGDTADDFACCVIELLTDRQFRRQLGQAGRQLAVHQFSWDRLARKQKAFWEAVGRPPQAASTFRRTEVLA